MKNGVWSYNGRKNSKTLCIIFQHHSHQRTIFTLQLSSWCLFCVSGCKLLSKEWLKILGSTTLAILSLSAAVNKKQKQKNWSCSVTFFKPFCKSISMQHNQRRQHETSCKFRPKFQRSCSLHQASCAEPLGLCSIWLAFSGMSRTEKRLQIMAIDTNQPSGKINQNIFQ